MRIMLGIRYNCLFLKLTDQTRCSQLPGPLITVLAQMWHFKLRLWGWLHKHCLETRHHQGYALRLCLPVHCHNILHDHNVHRCLHIKTHIWQYTLHLLQHPAENVWCWYYQLACPWPCFSYSLCWWLVLLQTISDTKDYVLLVVVQHQLQSDQPCDSDCGVHIYRVDHKEQLGCDLGSWWVYLCEQESKLQLWDWVWALHHRLPKTPFSLLTKQSS